MSTTQTPVLRGSPPPAAPPTRTATPSPAMIIARSTVPPPSTSPYLSGGTSGGRYLLVSIGTTMGSELVAMFTVVDHDGPVRNDSQSFWLSSARLEELWPLLLGSVTDTFDEVVLFARQSCGGLPLNAIAAIAPAGLVIHFGPQAPVRPGRRALSAVGSMRAPGLTTEGEVLSDSEMTDMVDSRHRARRRGSAARKAVFKATSAEVLVFGERPAGGRAAEVGRQAVVYADGSFLRADRVGGGAAYSSTGRVAALSSPTSHNITEVELEGVLCALRLLAEIPGFPPGLILTDSKDAVRLCRTISAEIVATRASKRSQSRIGMRLNAIGELIADYEGTISFDWVRGHCGTQGNEIADRVARLMARRRVAELRSEEGLDEQVALIVSDECHQAAS